jgi:hypothetical protein
MSCSGSHLGIMINIKSTKFVKDLPMIDAQFRFNQCNSFRALLQVEMEEMLTKNRYLYNCDRWLADDEDAHECVREMPVLIL